MKLTAHITAAATLLLATAHAGAVSISFEDLAEGSVLSTQYAALGVVFTPNVNAGLTAPNGSWASNTDMTITATDIGGLGAPAGLVGGKMVHAFGNVYDGWLGEDGDASFAMTFSSPVTFISAAFAGVSTPSSVNLYAYNGATLVGTATGSTTGQFVLSFSAPSITQVVVTPGDFNDWVSVDNIVFTPVPEASTYAMMALGLGLLAFKRRKAA